MTARFYVVGGAVRDALLGRPSSDRDWVAVGTTPEALLARGFRPVGKDFPVFLHPGTGEEVALARTERKSGRGYHGFAFHAAPEVTLEEDLRRRDLTINAIAQAEDGTLVDPYGGRADLQARVLRHVSEAFAEDPVRLLRLARLAARFPDFTVAPETQALLQRMVDEGEVDHLVPERVWQELSRGLMAEQPSRMLEVLRGCGALTRLLPGLPGLESPEAVSALLDECARVQAPLPVRWAGLCLGPPDPAAALAERLRVPVDCRELAGLLARERTAVQAEPVPDAAALVALFDRCDAWRRPARFEALLLACACETRARTGQASPHGEPAARLLPLLAAARGVDTAAVAAEAASQGLKGPAIGAAVQAARVAAVQARLSSAPR